MDRKEKNILFITNLHLWSLEKGKGGRAFINTVEGYKNAGWAIWCMNCYTTTAPLVLTAKR